MKIWPFDYAAEQSNGHHISNYDLNKALEPFAKIRQSVGDKIDICLLYTSPSPRDVEESRMPSSA